jgi:MFS family permease
VRYATALRTLVRLPNETPGIRIATAEEKEMNMSITRRQATAFASTEPRRTGHAPAHLSRGSLAAAMLAVCVAQVGLAIPAVLNGLFQKDLGTTAAQLDWISDAFLVPIVLLELTFGVLGDLFGRRRLLLVGAGLLVVGEVVSVLTPGVSASTDTRVAVLWAGQAVSGIGAAALFPASLAVVAASTHTAHERGRVISLWAAALSTGGFLSPVVGGALARLSFGSDPNASWRWAFIAVAVLAALSFLVSLALAEDSSSPEGRSLDWPGQITVAIGLFAVLFAVIQASTAGWGSTEVIVGFVVGAIFMALFIAVEHRVAAPLLRLELFTNRAFAVTALVTVVGMFAFLGTAYSASIRLSAIQGFSPLKTAIAFVLIQGFALVLQPVVARVLPRLNPRWVLGAGFLLIAAGDYWASSLSAAHLSIGPIIAPLVLVGIGFAFAVSSVTSVAVNTVPLGLTGMASATTSLLRDFGFTLGPAVIGAIALSRAASHIQAQIASHPTLQRAVNGFYAAPAHAPAAQRAALAQAVGAVKSGPLGANAVPATVHAAGHTIPLNPLKPVAFHALDQAFSLGFLVCGVSATVAALLVLFVLSHQPDRHAGEESVDAGLAV